MTDSGRTLPMQRAKQQLAEAAELLRKVRPGDAEQIVRSVVTTLSDPELRDLEADLRDTIEGFFPKRKAALIALLEKALASMVGEPAIESAPERDREPRQEPAESAGLAELSFDPDDPTIIVKQLTQTLDDLAERHIFQWSTHYRDRLAPLFEAAVMAEAALTGRNEPSFAPTIRTLIANHAYIIAGQGYHYTIRAGHENRAVAISKTLSGLQRFLELPIEFYSTLYGSVTTAAGAVALRRIGSAVVAGILEGYGSARYDEQDGWVAMARVPRIWAHYVGWLSARDLADLVANIGPSLLGDGLTTIVSTVASAIDGLVEERPLECTALPVLCQFDQELWRLSVSLEGSRTTEARLIEIQCYLDGSRVQLAALEEAAARRVALVVARLQPGIADFVESREHFRQLVLNTGSGTIELFGAPQRAKDILGLAIATEFGEVGRDTPLKYNFARDFPLQNPFIRHYFHVVRPTVRSLLGRFDRRNGVRLWCSLRRSGKTTATFDLGTTTGRSTVVTQTCERTSQDPDADLFYRMVLEALQTGEQLRDNFFTFAVERCSPPRRPTDIRFVFVLDEYETFFERIRLAVKRDAELRYTVAQPLFNQMVAFTRDNLLVFIGQRPDAHYIFMDQNQLSAYLEQDAFPLFEHREGWSEFSELLRKVASERIPFESAFVDAVFAETAGHPFLTAKVMIDFFDWLIDQRRSMLGLQLRAADFVAFRNSWLTPKRLSSAQEYQFFAHAIAEALSTDGRAETPWLHAVYSTMRQLAIDYPATFRCVRGDFEATVERMGITDELGYTADQLLGSASQANFFSFSDSEVWIRIPILGRIAQTARPKVSW